MHAAEMRQRQRREGTARIKSHYRNGNIVSRRRAQQSRAVCRPPELWGRSAYGTAGFPRSRRLFQTHHPRSGQGLAPGNVVSMRRRTVSAPAAVSRTRAPVECGTSDDADGSPHPPHAKRPASGGLWRTCGQTACAPRSFALAILPATPPCPPTQQQNRAAGLNGR